MSYNDPLCTFVFAPKIHASKIQRVEAIGQELKSVIKTNYPPEVLQLAPEELPKPKRKVISQPSFFRGYVKLRGGVCFFGWTHQDSGKTNPSLRSGPRLPWTKHGDSSGGSRSRLRTGGPNSQDPYTPCYPWSGQMTWTSGAGEPTKRKPSVKRKGKSKKRKKSHDFNHLIARIIQKEHQIKVDSPMLREMFEWDFSQRNDSALFGLVLYFMTPVDLVDSSREKIRKNLTWICFCLWFFTDSIIVIVNHHVTTIWENMFLLTTQAPWEKI